ncbi:flavodoxin family protein [Mangrovimonas sp. DI 80]|uniref:flavodoxin family protein n=1 Tax=Mangrovimonas sp. DI 80 TaxID=1779330 RepID=UPI000976B163|nr:flavodoxin family protein [Mangrovimonas sp. DI 80]OMP31436.1 dialkylresorcinol condensing enzyme DarA [Mangrovimonas sp. DI 80]
MKKVLVIHYSQSGQLTEIVNNISAPLISEGHHVDFLEIEMETPFPFPWPKNKFLDAFPESFLQIPQKIKPIPLSIKKTDYDLVIFGYSVWYLTPSIPANSFLESEEGKQLLANAKVVTVIGCRNMWVMAQEKVKEKLKAINAELVGNIVLVDRHINHVSVITIVKWMFTGEKKRYLGIFPKPGVSQKDIEESERFGTVISNALKVDEYSSLQEGLLAKGAVMIKPFLVVADQRANVLFSKWANLIQNKSNKDSSKRPFWIKIFKYYLLFAIWIIAPVVFILFLLSYLPLYGKIKRDKVYFSSVS